MAGRQQENGSWEDAPRRTARRLRQHPRLGGTKWLRSSTPGGGHFTSALVEYGDRQVVGIPLENGGLNC
jgi:hypothetical protein